MIKFFIVAFMLVPFPDDDMMIVQKPTFFSESNCQDHVSRNSKLIRDWLSDEFNGATVKRILCIDEIRIKELTLGYHV